MPSSRSPGTGLRNTRQIGSISLHSYVASQALISPSKCRPVNCSSFLLSFVWVRVRGGPVSCCTFGSNKSFHGQYFLKNIQLHFKFSIKEKCQKCLCMLSIIVLRKKLRIYQNQIRQVRLSENRNRPQSSDRWICSDKAETALTHYRFSLGAGSTIPVTTMLDLDGWDTSHKVGTVTHGRKSLRCCPQLHSQFSLLPRHGSLVRNTYTQ